MNEEKRIERIRETGKMDAFERARDKFEKNRKQQGREMPRQTLEQWEKPKIKKKMCLVTVMIVDQNGEYSQTWEAPHLEGTIISSKRNKEGYMEMIKPALEKAYGKLCQSS